MKKVSDIRGTNNILGKFSEKSQLDLWLRTRVYSNDFSRFADRRIEISLEAWPTITLLRVERSIYRRVKGEQSVSAVGSVRWKKQSRRLQGQRAKKRAIFSSLFPIGRLDFLSVLRRKKKRERERVVDSFDRASISLEIGSIETCIV